MAEYDDVDVLGDAGNGETSTIFPGPTDDLFKRLLDEELVMKSIGNNQKIKERNKI